MEDKEQSQNISNLLLSKERKLQAIYKVHEILLNYNENLSAIIDKLMKTIVSSFREPQEYSVKVRFNKRYFKSQNYFESEWNILSKFQVNIENAGEIIIFQKSEPEGDTSEETIKVEKQFLNAVALKFQSYLKNKYLREKQIWLDDKDLIF